MQVARNAMNITKKIGVVLTLFMVLATQVLQVFALDDGAYTITCSSSYVNPLTGQTEDGGTNIALGDSMVSSIVEKQLLLEQTQGNMYITVGLGLASNVSNIRFQLMNNDGTKTTVTPTITGSSQANGDTVHHYRIQISSLTQYISPIMYVNPMGRDVQFFIQLQTNTIQAGTGIYKSEMIPIQRSPNETKSSTPSDTTPTKDNQTTQNTTDTETPINKETTNTTTPEQKTEEKQTQNENPSKALEAFEITKEYLLKDVNGLSYHTIETTKNFSWGYGVIVAIVVIVVAGGFVYVKKIKK